MKKTSMVFNLLLLAVTGFAQRPIDSLAVNKRDWIAQYVPAEWGRLTYGSFMLEPEEFLSRLENFKKAAFDSVASEKNATWQTLKKKDIDAFSRVLLYNYIEMYGVDSAKEAQYFATMRSMEGNDSSTQRKMEEAYAARFVKKLPEATKTKLTSMVLNGWELNDSALFFNSAAYRQLSDIKIATIEEEKYNLRNGYPKDEPLLRQQVLNDVLGKGYVYEYYSYENIDGVINREPDSGILAQLYAKYMASAKNDKNKKKVAESYKNLTTYRNNSPAPDFTYKDISGKTVTLKSLRGKYVYIDVWATWCGPCKAEIPHLVKLEEALHGKKIHFVSISVDKQKDKGAWEKYVKEKDLKGIQLMVDKDIDSDFIRKFNITYIPRFILIAPDGKIVEANALRPSDKKLKEQLDTLL